MEGNLESTMSINSLLISIIVPVYNAEDYIDKCLQSLSKQTHKNIEIICVDDCSTDNSVNIIKQHINNDSRIKLYSTPQNSGPATTRNIGLDNAHGEYIMFCDNDDTYTEQMCEVMLKTIVEKQVEIVTCQANIENARFDTNLAYYINSVPNGLVNLNQNNKLAINVLLWNKIYKKSIVDKYSIRFPDGLSSEDDAFIMQYVSVINTYYGLKNQLYNHLFRKTSFTNTLAGFKAGKRKFDNVKLIEYFYDFLVKNNIFEREEHYFKQRVVAELKYLFIYNKKGDKTQTIKLYNEFVKNAELLSYNKYCYNNIYQKFDKKKNLFYLISFINKCYWF